MEDRILLALQELRSDELTLLLKNITHLGDHGMVWFAAAFICLAFASYRVAGVRVLAALALVGIVNNLFLKNIIDRERPFRLIEELVLLTDVPHGSSFPSGHTAGAFAAAYIFYRFLPKKYGAALLLLAALMGFSRMYVGAHYPSDVLGGVIVGCLCGALAERLPLAKNCKKQSE